jgi:Uma2 family endonuclease
MSSAQPAPRPWTYADLVALPDDQLRHELIDGEHVVPPSPNTWHQQILRELLRILDAYVERRRLGEVLFAPFDVKLSPFTVLVPDLIYFTADRFARVVNEKHATAAPDLVVEILSPGTRRRDKGRKRAITALRRPRADAGLTDVTTLTSDAGESLESPLFPGFRVHLRDVFRGR